MRNLHVMIAALDPKRWESVLCSDQYAVQACLTDGLGIAEAIAQYHPHLLLLQNELPSMDGFSVLRRLHEHVFSRLPHTVLILPKYCLKWEASALDAGADAVLYAPCCASDVEKAAHTALASPMPHTAASGVQALRRTVESLLESLGASKKRKGYDELARCVELCCASSYIRDNFDGLLYPAVATMKAVSPGAIEKNIRSLIEDTWLFGNLPEIQRLFGFSVDAERGKPTNRECILMLAEHAANALDERAAHGLSQYHFASR